MLYQTPQSVLLVDGTPTSSDGEAWRHECEARAILNLPSLELRRAWLEAIGKKRGQAEVQRLQHTMEALWKKSQSAANKNQPRPHVAINQGTT